MYHRKTFEQYSRRTNIIKLVTCKLRLIAFNHISSEQKRRFTISQIRQRHSRKFERNERTNSGNSRENYFHRSGCIVEAKKEAKYAPGIRAPIFETSCRRVEVYEESIYIDRLVCIGEARLRFVGFNEKEFLDSPDQSRRGLSSGANNV